MLSYTSFHILIVQRVLLYSPGCPRVLHLTASTSLVRRLQALATMADFSSSSFFFQDKSFFV